jgi:uncharacterized membrane protein
MSNEERKDLPPETGPETGRESWPLEDAQASTEGPVDQDRLGEELGDTADSVTRELRDLQDELIPPAATPAMSEEYVPSQEPAISGELPSEVPETEPVPAAPPTTSSERYAAPAAIAAGKATAAPEGTDDDRLLSMLAWLTMVILQLPVVSVIQLLSTNTKDRPFQRHHAVTSLVFWGASVVYEILATVVFVILTTVTLGCGAICLWIIFFVPHALALYYAFQAYGGKRVEIPYVSNFARQQGWL